MLQVLEKVFGRKTLGPNDKLKSVEDQTPDEKKLIGYVRQKVEEIRSSAARSAHEATWMQNTAYLLGYDNVYYDANAKTFRTVANTAPTSGAQKKTKVFVNTILPTVQNRLSRLCKNRPRYDVRPNSPDSEDKDAASLSLQVLNFYWEKLKINQKRIRLYMWIQQCGYAFVKTGWDPCAGERLVDPENPKEWIYEGDIKAEILSPFESFVDPLCQDEFDDALYFIHAKVRRLDYFRSSYERGYLVKEEETWLMSLQYENRINTANSQSSPGSGAQPQANSAIELTYYEKPTKTSPKGRFVVVANGVLLENKGLQIDEIPVSKFDDIVIAGKFDSEAIITHLKPVSDQFNRIVSKRADFFNKLMAGKYIAPRSARLSSESLTDENGEVLEYTPRPNAAEPKAMVMPNMPAYVYQETKEFKEMHYDISGIGEISRGTLPSAGIPAIGMQFLQEQDSTRIGVEVEQHEFAWAAVGRHILKFANQYVKSDRVLKMTNRNQGYVVKKWNGDRLKNHFDVIVISGSTLPNSKVLARQEILNLYDRGLLGNPADPKVVEHVLSLLEYGDIQEVWVDFSLDMKQIKEKITAIEEGEAPEPSEFDNHELVILEFNRYRKSDKYKTFSPEKKAAFNGVMEWHIQALMRLSNPGIATGEKLKQEEEQVMGSIMQNPDQINPLLQAEDSVAETQSQMVQNDIPNVVSGGEQ